MCGVETRSLARLAGPHRHHPQPGAGDGGVLGVPQLGRHRGHVWRHGEHEDRQIIITPLLTRGHVLLLLLVACLESDCDARLDFVFLT